MRWTERHTSAAEQPLVEAGHDVEQFRAGMDIELEHGHRDPSTDVTGNGPFITGKIAPAHLNEFRDYYTRLAKMEEEARRELERR